MRKYIFYTSCIFFLGASIFLGGLAYKLIENRNCSKSEECREKVVADFFDEVLHDRLKPASFELMRDSVECSGVSPRGQINVDIVYKCSVKTLCEKDFDLHIRYATTDEIFSVGTAYYGPDNVQEMLALSCPSSVLDPQMRDELLINSQQGG